MKKLILCTINSEPPSDDLRSIYIDADAMLYVSIKIEKNPKKQKNLPYPPKNHQKPAFGSIR